MTTAEFLRAHHFDLSRLARLEEMLDESNLDETDLDGEIAELLSLLMAEAAKP